MTVLFTLLPQGVGIAPFMFRKKNQRLASLSLSFPEHTPPHEPCPGQFVLGWIMARQIFSPLVNLTITKSLALKTTYSNRIHIFHS